MENNESQLKINSKEDELNLVNGVYAEINV